MSNRSFLKWAGGKGSALKSVFNTVPPEGGMLVEPFMGSCTVSLNTNYDKYILNDYNPDLVYLCEWVAKNPKEVIRQVQPLFSGEHNNRVAFEALRLKYNYSQDSRERAILFLYLNRHVYNGLMRYNQSQGFLNTSFGKYAEPKVPVEEMHAFSKKFKMARFVCSSYKSLRFVATPDTVVYCDPPYLPISPTASFSAYTALGFSMNAHLDLNTKAALWASRGCRVFLSNHDVPALSSCYNLAKSKNSFLVARTISRSKDNRKPVKEVLLTY